MKDDPEMLLSKPPSQIMVGLAAKRSRLADLAGERETLDAELQSIDARISHLEVEVGADKEIIKARDRRRHTLERLASCRRDYVKAEQEMLLWRDALMYLSRR